MNKQRELLEKNKYIYVKDMVSADQCIFLREGMEREISKGRYDFDGLCPRSFSIRRRKFMESAFPFFANKLNTMLELELEPTYAYGRHYLTNETMARHKDKDICEYSITLTVDYPKNKLPWEICFGERDRFASIPINRGDAVLYKGCEISHWRDPNPNPWQIQIFYHFVNSRGPYKDQVYSSREYYEFDQQMYEEFMRRGS